MTLLNWQYRFLLLILLLVLGAIIIAAVFLTRKPSSSTASLPLSDPAIASPSPSISASQSSGIASLSPSTTNPSAQTAPTSTSRTLQTCLDNFASTSASPYPCADCTPLLLGAPNDYNTPLVNGNSTGVGAALQYCTIMDVQGAGDMTAFEAIGWVGKATCGWSGIKCDSRGRVTEL
jgi:hypothetical protein